MFGGGLAAPPQSTPAVPLPMMGTPGTSEAFGGLGAAVPQAPSAVATPPDDGFGDFSAAPELSVPTPPPVPMEGMPPPVKGMADEDDAFGDFGGAAVAPEAPTALGAALSDSMFGGPPPGEAVAAAAAPDSFGGFGGAPASPEQAAGFGGFGGAAAMQGEPPLGAGGMPADSFAEAEVPAVGLASGEFGAVAAALPADMFGAPAADAPASAPAAPAGDAILLTKGEQCYYAARDGSRPVVKIAKIHLEDPPPYYTIVMPDGVERQTVRDKLTRLSESQEVPQPVEPAGRVDSFGGFVASAPADATNGGMYGGGMSAGGIGTPKIGRAHV